MSPSVGSTMIVPTEATMSPATMMLLASSVKHRCPGAWPGVWSAVNEVAVGPVELDALAVLNQPIDLDDAVEALRGHGVGPKREAPGAPEAPSRHRRGPG